MKALMALEQRSRGHTQPGVQMLLGRGRHMCFPRPITIALLPSTSCLSYMARIFQQQEGD